VPPAAATDAPPAAQLVPNRDKPPKTKAAPGEGAPANPLANMDPALAEQVQQARDDIELLEAQLEVKRAQVQAARVALETAHIQRKRLELLGANRVVSREDLDRAGREVAALQAHLIIKEAEVREPEVRLRQARRRLAALERRAPTIVDPGINEAWADALFAHRLIDFGNVQRGLKLEFQFRLINKTKGPVRIEGLRGSSAAVIIGGQLPAELKPGQQEYITGVVDTSRLTGNKTVFVHVQFSHPRPAEVKLAIRVNSVPAGQTRPDTPPETKQPGDRDKLLDLEKKLGELLKEVESLRKRFPPPQRKPAPDEIEINSRTFSIPIMVTRERNDIREVKLLCSVDGGGTWEQVATLPPTANAFRFEAPADGIYWFNVAIVSRTGKAFPAEMVNTAPALKVLVRTNP
jgi:hypothetical protein